MNKISTQQPATSNLQHVTGNEQQVTSNRIRPRDFFRLIDHTADIGIEVWGAGYPELFEHAAAALTQLLTDPETINELETRELEVTGYDPEDLLINWLRQILYLFQGEGFLTAVSRVTHLTDTTLSAGLVGERWDSDRHPLVNDIKAVTYHGVQITRRQGNYFTRIIFDV
ncbi:MAG: archease [Deltaproteobacteria bacterium]|nr:archease [Deltaproteobacteria bacterium]